MLLKESNVEVLYEGKMVSSYFCVFSKELNYWVGKIRFKCEIILSDSVFKRKLISPIISHGIPHTASWPS